MLILVILVRTFSHTNERRLYNFHVLLKNEDELHIDGKVPVFTEHPEQSSKVYLSSCTAKLSQTDITIPK